MCANYNEKLIRLIVDNFGDIITKLKEVIKPINDGSSLDSTDNSNKTLDDIIYLSQLKFFHVFVINEKQTVLVVDTQNRIFEITCKIANVSKSSTKSKKGKIESFVQREIPGNEEIKDICCGESHTLVLTQCSKVYAWGNNYYGQIGNKSVKDSEQPVYVNIAINEGDFFKKVCCGYYHNLVLSDKGLLYAWGRNDEKQCWDKKEKIIKEPIQILENIANLIDMSCGAYHSIALDINGNVYTWGRNDFGQLGIGLKQTDKSCHKIKMTKKVDKIVSGHSHNLLLTKDGEIYAFGSNQFKQISDANQANFSKPTQIDFAKSAIYQDIASSISIPVSLASVKNFSNIDKECYAIGLGVIGINKNEEISIQQWFLKYKKCTYKPINFQCFSNTLANKTNRFERIEACFWSAANNILENYEFDKSKVETQQQILENEKKYLKIKNLFTKLMYVNNQIPINSAEKREFAKLNIYHTLNANLWENYELNPKRLSNDFNEYEKLGTGVFGTVYRARYIKIGDQNNSKENNSNNSNENNSNNSSDDNRITKYNELVAIKRIAINEYDVKKLLRQIELSKNLNNNFVVRVKRFWMEYNELINKSGQFKEEYNRLMANNALILLNIESELCVTSLDKIIEKMRSNKETADRNGDMANIFMLPLGYYIASELVLEILSAVDYLHRHRLTHRNLKPQNILIKNFKDYDGIQRFLKIGDFGLSVLQTNVNIEGTKDYIPPEVLTKDSYTEVINWRLIEKDMDTQGWDLFSIGHIFKEMFFIHNIQSDDDYKQKSVTIHESLQIKYKKLFDETKLLKSVTADNRPKCIELLKNDRHSNYLMDKDECVKLCKDVDLSKYKQPLDKELELTINSFIEFFLRKKLN